MILASGTGNLAGPLGLLVILLLGAACWLLFKSMTSRIKRLPKSFDEDEKQNDE